MNSGDGAVFAVSEGNQMGRVRHYLPQWQKMHWVGGRALGYLNDLPPEKESRYNIVKGGNKWSGKVIHQSKSSTNFARLR